MIDKQPRPEAVPTIRPATEPDPLGCCRCLETAALPSARSRDPRAWRWKIQRRRSGTPLETTLDAETTRGDAGHPSLCGPRPGDFWPPPRSGESWMSTVSCRSLLDLLLQLAEQECLARKAEIAVGPAQLRQGVRIHLVLVRKCGWRHGGWCGGRRCKRGRCGCGWKKQRSWGCGCEEAMARRENPQAPKETGTPEPNAIPDRRSRASFLWSPPLVSSTGLVHRSRPPVPSTSFGSDLSPPTQNGVRTPPS